MENLYDHASYETVVSWLGTLDAEETRYTFELDITRQNGSVNYNFYHRMSGCEAFKARIADLLQDESVRAVSIRVYTGMSPTSNRFDRSKRDREPDYAVMLREPAVSVARHDPLPLEPPRTDQLSELKDEMGRISQQQQQVFLGLLGIDTHSGMDSVASTVRTAQTLWSSREQSIRAELELERLKDKLEEAKEKLADREGRIKRLEEEMGRLGQEADEWEARCEQLEKYDINRPGGVANVAMQLGSLALGNVVKGYARRHPAKVAGLLGIDVAEMLGGEATPTPEPAPAGNPKVEQIQAWLRAQDAQTVAMVYQLICEWDENPGLLPMMWQRANGRGQTATAPRAAAESVETNAPEIQAGANTEEV